MFFLIIIFTTLSGSIRGSSIGSLHRNKRYVAFPDGASLSIALCMTQQTIIPVGTVFTEGVNWGIAYQLPNKTTYLENLKTHNKHFIRKRDRANLYGNIEVILENFGLNGRDCILRALCEAPRILTYEEKTLPEKLVETIFKFPVHRNNENSTENQDYFSYSSSANHGLVTGNCDKFSCPISLIHALLEMFNGQLSIG